MTPAEICIAHKVDQISSITKVSPEVILVKANECSMQAPCMVFNTLCNWLCEAKKWGWVMALE